MLQLQNLHPTQSGMSPGIFGVSAMYLWWLVSNMEGGEIELNSYDITITISQNNRSTNYIIL